MPSSFPPTLPNDRVLVQYLMAPLLEAEVGPIFKYFDLFHGGLAFTNTRTNFTFTTNYDSIDLNLFSSQLPTIVTAANGTKSLLWHSEGFNNNNKTTTIIIIAIIAIIAIVYHFIKLFFLFFSICRINQNNRRCLLLSWN